MAQSPARLVLGRARALIENPDNWVQGAWKQKCEAGGYKRCAYQALEDAADELGLPSHAAFDALTRAIGDDCYAPRRAIPAFNDAASHKDVLAKFDLALGSS